MYRGNHFAIYMCQINTLYIINLHNVIYQLYQYINKAEGFFLFVYKKEKNK